MPKLNYLRSLIDSLDQAELKTLVEDYAKQNKGFEAFLLEKSGKVIDTGKTYQDYREELEKILQKCKTRKGYVKVTRLNNAGIADFRKLLNSHFKNENFQISLWMSLALMESMHQAVLINTRYKWGNHPYKTFEKMMGEARDQFGSSWKMANVTRKLRQSVFKALVRCWWRERESSSELRFFETEDLFQYSERDEDLMTIQLCLQELKTRAKEIDKQYATRITLWKKAWSDYFGGEINPDRAKRGLLMEALGAVETRVKEELEKWE
ncbi:MAG: hypothetical protein Q8O95_02335 [bacterium]|nr:hypothetical protein [bacterium]